MDLAIYSDATALGGAEVNLSRVIAALPGDVRLTIVGVDDKVVHWLRSHRPGSRSMCLPAISNRSDARGFARHRAMFTRLGADVLQFNLSTASSCQWAILAATTISNLPLIAIENSPMGVWSALSGRLKRYTSGRLAAHIAVGDRTGRMIEESSGLVPGSIETIYHGVPEVGREAVDRSEEPTFLTVARHDPVKGVDVLLEAFALVEEPSRLVLIGDGSESASLKSLCHRLGLDGRVTFQALPWDRRAADLMWAYDALVLPSRLEGFPVTIAEAMLAGTAVIATNVGSVAEAVLPGETGWIVPPENPSALAAAMNELLAAPQQADLMGAKAREIGVARFSIEATIEAYMDLYRRVMS